MSDIFREIEEEVRRQQYAKLWQQYGIYAIAAAVLIVAITGGYIAWKNWRQTRLDEASIAFSKLIDKTQDNPGSSADEIATFTANAPGGYRALGLFAEAAATMPKDKIAAAKLYDQIVEEFPDPYFGGLARLKGAMLMSDTLNTAQLKERLAPIMTDESVWRYSARELVAYSLFRDGDLKGAREAFDGLRSDLAVPEGLRNRAEQMVSQIDLRLGGITPRVMEAPKPPGGPQPDPANGATPPQPNQPQPDAPQAQNTPAPASPQPAPPATP